MDDPSANRGTSFVAVGWTLLGIAILATAARLYSRLALTRSAGSDDFFIFLTVALNIMGQAGDTIGLKHGLGRHEQYLTAEQISTVTKWDFIGITKSFLCFFALRSSVILFTLRLLPISKRWPQRVIEFAFFLNFAITMIAVVSYGVRCVPFTAIYKSVPGSRCEPQNALIATQRVNGVLGCIIDIATAMIPAFLLWNLSIKRKTKIFLHVIFSLGLITSVLSIGRAATTNIGELQQDFTWRIIPPNYFTNIEEKLGIILASCPALRQFFVYYRRAGTVFPSNARQPPNADFVNWRQRVKLRDVFWYRTSPASAYTQPEAIRAGTGSAADDVENSPLEKYTGKLKSALSVRSASRKLSPVDAASESRAFARSQSGQALQTEDSSSGDSLYGEMKEQKLYQGPPTIDSERRRIKSSYEAWGLHQGEIDDSSGSNERQVWPTFLRMESAGSVEAPRTFHRAKGGHIERKDETSEDTSGRTSRAAPTLRNTPPPADACNTDRSAPKNPSLDNTGRSRDASTSEDQPAMISHRPLTASVQTPRLVYIPPHCSRNSTQR